MKKLLSILLSAAFLMTTVFSTAIIIPTFAEENTYTGVFKYGGFEENKKWSPIKGVGSKAKVKIVEPGADNSKYSLEINRTDTTSTALSLTTTSLPGALDDLDKNVKYCFSLGIRTDGDFTGRIYLTLKQGNKTVTVGGTSEINLIGSKLTNDKINYPEWKSLLSSGFEITGEELQVTLNINGKGKFYIDNADITVDPEEENLIKNGGFEEGGWYTEKMNGSYAEQVSDVTDNSIKAMHLVGTQEDGTVNVASDAKSWFDRSKTYTLSLSLKTKDVAENKLVVRILQWSADESGTVNTTWLKVYGLEEIIRTGGTTDWATYTVTCRKFTSGTNAGMRLYVSLIGEGEAWVDNVVMKEKKVNVDVGAGTVSADVQDGEVDPMTIVHLLTASEDADIYYTVDGSDPHTSQTKLLYNDDDAIIITADTTVKAYVATESEPLGEIAEFNYECESILPNADFENGLWTASVGGAAQSDSSVKKSGNKSMRIDGNGSSLTASTGFIPLDTNFDYKLSFWVKTENMSMDNSAFVSVFMSSNAGIEKLDDKMGVFIKSRYGLIATEKSQDWTHYEVTLDELKGGFSDINITVGIKNDTGTAWFDGFSLIAVQSQYYPLSLSSAVADGQLLGSIYSQNVMDNFEISKTVTLKSNAKLEETGKINYEVCREDGSVISDGSFEAGVGPLGRQDYTINLSTIAEYGTFTVNFKMENSSGFIYPLETLEVSRIRDATKQAGKTKLAFSSHAMTGGYLDGKYDRESIDKYMDMLVSAGVSCLREEVLSANIIKDGDYVFPEWWDTYVDSARAHGIEVLIVINSHGGFWGSNSFPTTNEELETFTRYAEAVVNKFKGRVKYFELFNETNYSKVTDGAGYAAMLKYVYPRLKAASADSQIVAGVLSHADTVYAEAILKAGGADYMDVFSFHPYVYPKSPESGSFKSQIAEMKALFNKYTSKDIHFQLTELGWSSCENDYGVTEEQKADYLLRALQTANELDYVDYMMQYETHMGGNKYALESNWGALNVPYSSYANPYAAKPTFIGYGAFNSLLAGYKYAGEVKLSDTVYVRRYDNVQSGKTMWLLWTDDIETRATVTLGKSGARLFDFYGNATGITYNSDGISFNEIFSGSIMYLQTDSSDSIKSITTAKNETTDNKADDGKSDNTVSENENNETYDNEEPTEETKKTTKKIKRIKRVSGKKGTNTEDDGFPVWAIVLIAVGGALVLAAGTFFIIFFVRKRKRKAN